MQPDPTIPDSFGYGLDFLGEILFKWVPGMVATVAGTADPSVGTTTLELGDLAQPIYPGGFADLLQRVSSDGAFDALVQGWSVFVLFSLLLSLPFIMVSVYCLARVVLLRRKEEAAFRAVQRPVEAKDVSKTQLRWAKILEHSRSDAEHDWRIAILEADILLNELLDVQGYKGETMADKMKQVDRAKFNTIDLAWEAHKVRNRVAHEGSAHSLTSREARRVIGLYTEVLKEFGYVH